MKNGSRTRIRIKISEEKALNDFVFLSSSFFPFLDRHMSGIVQTKKTHIKIMFKSGDARKSMLQKNVISVEKQLVIITDFSIFRKVKRHHENQPVKKAGMFPLQEP